MRRGHLLASYLLELFLFLLSSASDFLLLSCPFGIRMETKLFQAPEGPCSLKSHVSKNICEFLLAQSPPPYAAALPPPKT